MVTKFPALILCAACLCAQDTGAFRSDVALVHVDAGVANRSTGRVIGRLTRDDFRIFDNNTEQPLAAFSAEEQPLDLILLFDVSGSMHPLISRVVTASHEALKDLRAGDRVQVVSFAVSIRKHGEFTGELGQIQRNIDDVMRRRFLGPTDIPHAIDQCAWLFRGEANSRRRRAILIVTDNISPASRKEPAILRDLWEADAIVSGLILPRERLRGRHRFLHNQSEGGMTPFADRTGGDFTLSGDPAAFPETIRRIRTRYSLWYRMPEGPSGSARTVRVELTPEAAARLPDAHVTARRSYSLP